MQRALEVADRFVHIGGGKPFVPGRPASQQEIDRVRVVRPLAHRAQILSFDELYSERVGEPRDEVDLQLAKLAALAVEPVGPDMRAGAVAFG